MILTVIISSTFRITIYFEVVVDILTSSSNSGNKSRKNDINDIKNDADDHNGN